MKRSILVLMLLIIVVVGAVVACKTKTTSTTTNTANSSDETEVFTADQVKHGEYLVAILVCDDCHSPKVFGPQGPEVDTTRRLSGHPSELPLAKVDTGSLKSWVLFSNDFTAAVGTWGASFSANLTSDETGIGNWSLGQFKKAIREGKYKGLDGSRPLLPPMPWQQYMNLSDDDLRDIFAFLKSTKPVRNIVPAPVPFSKL